MSTASTSAQWNLNSYEKCQIKANIFLIWKMLFHSYNKCNIFFKIKGDKSNLFAHTFEIIIYI